MILTSSTRRQEKDPNRPTLRRSAPDNEIPVDAEPIPGNGEEDERPKLERKYDVMADGI